MSTIVCQNLVSRFESQITETTTTLKLRVAAPPTPPPTPAEVKTNPDFGNWGCLQTASNENSIGKENNFYTHPLDKKKSLFSALSTKSLELCTENLGSETGTDIVTESSGAAVFSATPSVYTSNSGGNPSPRKRIEIGKPKRETKTPINIHYAEDDSRRKIKNFPPPLTTISGHAGSSSLQVRRHTEGGRLIIEAVEAPVRSSCLRAERSGGRLRLCLLTGSDSAATTTGEEVENGNECGGETEEEEEINDSMTEIESEEEEEEFDEEVNLEMEIEKIQRLSRCKERSHGNRGLCSDFKPALWVATS